MKAAEVQQLSVRAMWMAISVSQDRTRQRFLRSHDLPNSQIHARAASMMERKIASVADELIAHLSAAARGAA